jgi:hypothetical protein
VRVTGARVRGRRDERGEDIDAPGRRLRERLRPLPDSWRPRGVTQDRLEAAGFKLDELLRLFRRAMVDRRCRRWTDRQFLCWLDREDRAGALPAPEKKAPPRHAIAA